MELYYFFIFNNCNAVCLICLETVVTLKELIIKRHFDAKRLQQYKNFTGQVDSENFDQM